MASLPQPRHRLSALWRAYPVRPFPWLVGGGQVVAAIWLPVKLPDLAVGWVPHLDPRRGRGEQQMVSTSIPSGKALLQQKRPYLLKLRDRPPHVPHAE